MPRLSLSHIQLSSIFSHRLILRAARLARPLASVFLLLAISMLSVPPPVLATGLRKVASRSSEIAKHAEAAVARSIGLARAQKRGESRGMPVAPVNRSGAKRQPKPSKPDREARVASIRINSSETLALQSRESMLFAGIPVDSEGAPIHGLRSNWESSDRNVVFISRNGQALAGNPGKAILTATAGSVRQSIKVTVIEGSRSFGQKKRENSRRQPKHISRTTAPLSILKVSTKSDSKRHHSSAMSNLNKAGLTSGRSLLPMLPLRDPNVDPLPDDETNSLYLPANNVGSPPGKTRPGASTPAVATMGTETGNKNFTFGLPIVGLPGRGIDVSLSLTYNSLVYNKLTEPFDSSTWLTYDVDSGWPAPASELDMGKSRIKVQMDLR